MKSTPVTVKESIILTQCFGQWWQVWCSVMTFTAAAFYTLSSSRYPISLLKVYVSAVSPCMKMFLNQERTGLWLVHTWFLRIALSANISMCVCLCVYVCVCPPLRLLIISGMMWWDIDPYDWYGFCMAAVIGFVSGRSLNMHTHRRN